MFWKYSGTNFNKCSVCISVYITDSNANPVLQSLLLVLHKVDLDLCNKVIHKVIKRSRIKDDLQGTKWVCLIENLISFI